MKKQNLKKSVSLLVSTLFFLNPSLQVFAQTALHKIDVSGRNGTDAVDGYSYTGQAQGYGQNGRNGGNATEATPGQDAGNINIKLSRSAIGLFTIRGVIQESNGSTQNIQTNVQIGTQGSLYLLAKGGRAGKAGNGGNAEGGGYGYRGSDATEYSNGTNGGPGGNGGDPGLGSDGKKSGDSGKVIIELEEKDTALLMLVEHDVSPTEGSKAGQHGEPGRGGDGGSGGSSYSWTTQRYTGDSVTYDSDGRESSRTQNYTTDYHSNPGGSSGSSGSSGRRQTKTLHNGEDGKEGTFKIRVIDENGITKEYTKRYDLKLLDYDIVSDNQDGIIEPGEKVNVKNLKVKNTGGSPTPSKTKVRIFLTNSKYAIAESVELEIPKSLEPNEEFTFTQKDLAFVVGKTLLTKPGEERAKWLDHVQPLAEMTEVNRAFNGFSAARQFEITYPIEIEPITTVRSLAPGESSKLMFKITNNSLRDFGDESEIQRSIAYLLKKSGGDLKSGQIKISDLDGKPLDLEQGLFAAIKNLKSKQSVLFEANVTVANDAEAYRSSHYGLDLNLGKINQADIIETVQKRTVRFNISQTYQQSPDSNYLIVVNSSTSADALNAWKKQLEDLGQKANVWDVSYYGQLALTEALQNGSSLADDFKGKTLIVLNNEFDTNQKKRTATEFLSQADLLRVASEHGIGTLVVGENPQVLKDRINEFNFPGKTKQHMKISDYLADVKNDAKTNEQRGQDFTSSYDDISVSRFSFFGKPKFKAEKLTAEAARLQKYLDAKYPERNYQVVYNFSPELLKKGFLKIGGQWRLGAIQVVRTLDTNQGSLINLSMNSHDVENPEIFADKEVFYSLMLATPFTQKLKLLKGLIEKSKVLAIASDVANENQSKINNILEAVLTELVIEQSVLRKQSWSFNLSTSELESKLVKLKMIKELGVKLDKTVSDEIKVQILGVLSTLEKMNSVSTSWWEYLTPFRRNPRLSSATSDAISEVQKSIFSIRSIFGKKDENALTSKEFAILKKQADVLAEKGLAIKTEKVTTINAEVKSEILSSREAQEKNAGYLARAKKIDKISSAINNDKLNLKFNKCEILFKAAN